MIFVDDTLERRKTLQISYLFAPEHNFLLLEVATVLFINKDEVKSVSARETIIYIFICGG